MKTEGTKDYPVISNQSIKARPTDTIERYSLRKILYGREIPEQEIQWKLRRFGLDAKETELIMLRFIDNRKILDIVKIQGWAGREQASYFLKKALKKLREGRFSL